MSSSRGSSNLGIKPARALALGKPLATISVSQILLPSFVHAASWDPGHHQGCKGGRAGPDSRGPCERCQPSHDTLLFAGLVALVASS